MRSSTLSRIELRVEDVLTVVTAAVMLLFLGVKSFGLLHLDEARYWDFAFILLPVALLIFRAAVRYAFRPIGSGGTGTLSAETGDVFRDWFPFLVFLLIYESFRTATWAIVAPVDKDALLLRWDLALFGGTGSVWFDPYVRGWLTSVLTIAYFLHLVLPPVMGLLWYRRDLRVFRSFLLSVLIAFIIGSQGYMLVPAIGPGMAFPSLYHHTLSGSIYTNITELIDTVRAPRDVFPSLHVGLSTIVLWFAWRRGRPVFAVFLLPVVANWISTLYLRAHYTIDVIAGWIVAAAAIWLAEWALRVEARLRGATR
jgi:membrane-associated phospholipid phosphatase